MKPIWVSSGEPAGIGPDICIALAGHPLPLVILADPDIMQARAKQLGIRVNIELYNPDVNVLSRPHTLYVDAVPCPVLVTPGVLNAKNSSYVLQLLTLGAERCLSKEGSGLVTAPVHKAIINAAGIPFTGHTEFFAQYTHTETVVMLLASEQMRVSLATTHLPLRDVPMAINTTMLTEHIRILAQTLSRDFALTAPKIKVAGLNPHAGEGGYLGDEEINIISPVIKKFQEQGLDIQGPYSADTLFVDRQNCDAYITMYHDQGLPVLKYASFGSAVNITCGLPFLRTSVDHGTALDLAGTGQAIPNSLLSAVTLTSQMIHNQKIHHD